MTTTTSIRTLDELRQVTTDGTSSSEAANVLAGYERKAAYALDRYNDNLTAMVDPAMISWHGDNAITCAGEYAVHLAIWECVKGYLTGGYADFDSLVREIDREAEHNIGNAFSSSSTSQSANDYARAVAGAWFNTWCKVELGGRKASDDMRERIAHLHGALQ